MTRITNFRYKRQYVSSTEAPTVTVELEAQPDAVHDDPPEALASSSEPQPQKKKRKRSRSKKSGDIKIADDTAASDEATGAANPEKDLTTPTERTPRQKRRDREKWEKERRKKAAEARKQNKPEIRRLKRRAEIANGTTCFACREIGHAAKDCPTTKKSLSENPEAGGNTIVGICYRCGSSTHTLSRCKIPLDPHNPMPFASCFVCSKKGHLASGCPQNKDKGIYPNGGCCKLCGETTHLARDCGRRKTENVDQNAVLGIGEAGADEDDFLTFKRRKVEIDREESGMVQKRKSGDEPSKQLEGTTPRPNAPKPRKVVNF